MGIESGSFVYMAIETKEESIETSSSIIMVPITEPPKKTATPANVEMGQKEEEEKKRNLKAKLLELRDYEGPRYMQANTLLRRYYRHVQEEPLAGDPHHQVQNQVLLLLVLHRPQPALASNRRVSGPRKPL